MEIAQEGSLSLLGQFGKFNFLTTQGGNVACSHHESKMIEFEALSEEISRIGIHANVARKWQDG